MSRWHQPAMPEELAAVRRSRCRPEQTWECIPPSPRSAEPTRCSVMRHLGTCRDEAVEPPVSSVVSVETRWTATTTRLTSEIPTTMSSAATPGPGGGAQDGGPPRL
ncbi:unnamed protein product [Symbiodinium sp. CCMP2592]|nr:unnamed protein product [Symbiodinium sp. CCMP2592]